MCIILSKHERTNTTTLYNFPGIIFYASSEMQVFLYTCSWRRGRAAGERYCRYSVQLNMDFDRTVVCYVLHLIGIAMRRLL